MVLWGGRHWHVESAAVQMVGETTLISLSRLLALRRKLDVSANNVANSGTVGFRAQSVSFQEHLKPEKVEVGVKPERPLSLVDVPFGFANPITGAFRVTGNPFDLAVQGNSYFVIQTPQGQRYTRDGSFNLDDKGRIVTLAGHPVLGEGGPIIVRSQDGPVGIDSVGRLSTIKGEIGSLRLVNFGPTANLQIIGGNLYQADQAPIGKSPDTKVLQGMLEQSNVNPTVEMSRIIEITRSYEAASKILKDSQDPSELNKLAYVPD